MKRFEKMATIIGAEMPQETFEKIDFFVRTLSDWNLRVNLVSKQSAENIWSNHIVPSLAYALFMDFNGKYIDIGTGAGLPGLVLKIVFPRLNIDLVDSNRKKTLFCKYIISELNISGVALFNDRVENLTQVYTGALFRSVSSIPNLHQMARPVIKRGGHFLSLKGRDEKIIEPGEHIKVIPLPKEITVFSEKLKDSVIIQSFIE